MSEIPFPCLDGLKDLVTTAVQYVFLASSVQTLCADLQDVIQSSLNGRLSDVSCSLVVLIAISSNVLPTTCVCLRPFFFTDDKIFKGKLNGVSE